MKERARYLCLFIAIFLAAIDIPAQSPFQVVRLNGALDDIISSDAKVEKLAGGFGFVEGPIWFGQGNGYLLFSDLAKNVINKWVPNDKVSVFLESSGFTGKDASDVGQQLNNGREVVAVIGSNGLTADRQGRVVLAAHGDRNVVRLEKDGRRTVLADRFEGRRLNSPDDLVYKLDGALYFTDPSYGLRKLEDDPKRELSFNGVFLLRDGKLQLLERSLVRPNGLAFAPGEKYLYVNDTSKKLIMRYEVKSDDTIANGQVFIDMTADTAPGVPDGMKVDQKGNVYCTGPGGFWIMSPEGRHLGTVRMPELPANFAFGDADGKTLYLTARTGLYRMRLKIPGIRP
jgi:gluconolactonase